MGCSNPHPHGQAWSLSAIPTLPARELDNMKQYTTKNVHPSNAPKLADGKTLILEGTP